MDFSSLWERVAPVLAALFSALLVVNLLARRLPTSTVARLETVAPRVANALRLLRAIGPDLDKALRVVFALVTGKPWTAPAVLLEDDRPTDPPPPPATPSVGLLALVFALIACVGCAATPHKIATDTVVTAGDVAQGLVEANDRIYTRATNELRASLAGDGGTLALYREQSAPITSEYLRRTDAAAALSAQLFAAAGLIDLARHGGAAQYVRAARLCLTAIDELLEVLAEGALLPPVPVPPELLSIVATLRALAGGVQ